MPAFVPPFAPAGVTYVGDVPVDLPDPAHVPQDPIVRPGVARYVTRTIVLLHVTTSGPVTLRSPVAGTVRRVSLPGTLPGTTELLEIEPLPFRIAPALRALPPGSPTFYLAFEGGPGTIVDDSFFNGGETIATIPAGRHLYVGLLFQDGAALAPWSWIDLLGRAMQLSGDAAGASAWNALAALYAALPRTIRVLDHDGRLAGAGRAFTVTAAGQPPVTQVTGAQSELSLGSGAVTVSWQGDPLTGDPDVLPVQAIYERVPAVPGEGTISAAPGGSIVLPAAFARGHLQLLDLSRWYARPPFDGIAARYHANCRVEPLLDGVASFKRLVGDLTASRSPDGSAYFSGLIFNNFDLDKGRQDPLSPGTELDTSIIGLTNYIRNNGAGGEVRMQFDKFIKLNEGGAPLENTARKAVLTAALLATSSILFIQSIESLRVKAHTDELAFHAVWALSMATFLLAALSDTALEAAIEPSLDLFGEINEIAPHIAIWARHPVRIADNPLANRDLFVPGFRIEELQERIGSWHQKLQAIKRGTPDAQGHRIIGYLGGIDINRNRLDTPGHQTTSPYHDVHARVTGTAAWDVHQTWRERYDFEREQHVTLDNDATVPALSATLPDYRVEPAVYPAAPQRHLVQVGRTYFLPAAGGTTLPFSTVGERTIYDTYVRALREARSYIHLEDQYFTPNSSPAASGSAAAPPGSPAFFDALATDVFFDMLLEAARHCRRLVIMIPREGDQPFGMHRRAFLIAKLREVWQDRLFVGVPLRRPLLPDPGVVASKGRATLLEDIAAGAPGPLLVGPEARVPKTPPFWLWIYGELMLCTQAVNATDAQGLPAKRLTVVRVGPWRARPRTHTRGAPVTFSQLKGPFVHAKVIMVDDVFVGIGSTNLTRRAFFHEGEIHAFAVPEALRAAADNPALALRTALWAEHLGLPPSLGAALLADPLAAFEYFRRPMLGGNRSTPVEDINERPHMGGAFDEDSALSAVKNLLSLSAVGLLEPFWNTFSDSTTNLDPRPLSGPFE